MSETRTDHIGLRKIVYNLKEEYKVLVELSYFQGYTQDEIAKMMGIPLGTVKTRLRTALIQLREIIKP
jgi:RNA polymerase sigma factor (sigma-70 family)